MFFLKQLASKSNKNASPMVFGEAQLEKRFEKGTTQQVHKQENEDSFLVQQIAATPFVSSSCRILKAGPV